MVAGVARLLSAQGRDARPNILLIIADDQRYDALRGYMPQTEGRIFNQGMSFEKAYVTTPVCCPSRSTIFTGQYAFRHGVRVNPDPLIGRTFVDALHDAGYATALVGKFLNSWEGQPRPEFDYWVAFRFGSVGYIDPLLNENGKFVKEKGYITDILRDKALDFIDQHAETQRPFALIFAPNAPHAPANPAAEDVALYSDLQPYRPENYNQIQIDFPPEWLRRRGPMAAERRAQMDIFRLNQLRVLRSLDRAIGAVLDRLTERSALDNTVVFYISDNGVFWGEFGLESKDCVYEPAIHVPLAVRYPPIISGAAKDFHLTANLDIAPTIYELSQVNSPPGLDGLSLVPLLRSEPREWRRDILIEGWRDTDSREPFRALHSLRFVYVENSRSGVELYDLDFDPFQLENAAARPEYENIAAEMKRRLREITGGAFDNEGQSAAATAGEASAVTLSSDVWPAFRESGAFAAHDSIETEFSADNQTAQIYKTAPRFAAPSAAAQPAGSFSDGVAAEEDGVKEDLEDHDEMLIPSGWPTPEISQAGSTGSSEPGIRRNMPAKPAAAGLLLAVPTSTPAPGAAQSNEGSGPMVPGGASQSASAGPRLVGAGEDRQAAADSARSAPRRSWLGRALASAAAWLEQTAVFIGGLFKRLAQIVGRCWRNCL